MHWQDLPFDPSRRTLQHFAALLIVCACVVGARQWFASHETRAAIVVVCGVAIGVLGLIAPRMVRPIFVGWLVIVFPIGWVVSRLILVLLFACVVTPIALIFRWYGRDVLRLRRVNAESYWIAKPPARDVTSYYRQF